MAAEYVELFESIPSRIQYLICGYIRNCYGARGHHQHAHAYDATVTPRRILIECALFYYIDYAETQRLARVYELYIDPSLCGNDIELDEWESSMRSLTSKSPAIDKDVSLQIFNGLDRDQNGLIHKSDFVDFMTCIDRGPKQTPQQRLQSLLMRTIDAVCANADIEQLQSIEQTSEHKKARKNTKMEQRLNIIRRGIAARKHGKPDKFGHDRVHEWVIHEVIDWMDSIEMQAYSKHFADFERPWSGPELLNARNMNMFRLQVDFDIPAQHALQIIREVDKLRSINADSIDSIRESRWLQTSFRLLNKKYVGPKTHDEDGSHGTIFL